MSGRAALKRRAIARPAGSARRTRPVVMALEHRTLLAAEPLLISEFSAANSAGLRDQDGDASDWAEIYNPGAIPVSLADWSLTDNATQPRKWTFPAVTVGPGQFLTVFASDKNRAIAGSELHTNFKLSAGGEYLGLIRPDGSVADAYTPQFPEQRTDISYGRPMGTSQLVAAGASASYYVPTDGNLGSTWTQPGFAGGASWTTRTTGLGYGVRQPGFAVYTAKAKGAIDAIAQAQAVLGNSNLQLSLTRAVYETVNFLGTGPSEHFGADSPFDGLPSGDDIDDFAMDARGTIQIPASGPWTFGVNSDDGFELTLSRNGVQFNMSYPGVRAPGDTLQTFNIPEAGEWDARLVYFERNSWSSVEFFAAQGAQSEFNSSFGLVGGTAPGALKVFTAPLDSSIVSTDVRTAMQSVNSSLYLTIPFFVADPAAYDSLSLRMRYDDGFVAYLNGVEVARANAPAALAWNSSAVGGRGGAEFLTPELFGLTAHLNKLRAGLNILAIQGLNVSPADGDFLILPELIATDLDAAGGRYFAQPTPGDYNSTPYNGLLGDVQFSVERGFYTASQSLALTSNNAGAVIRYTLDGSTPTSTYGQIYAAPISINKTTIVRAAAFRNTFLPSQVTTNTYLFLDDVVTQSPNGQPPAGWPADWGNNVVNYGMDPDIVNDPTFGGQALKNALLAIPSVSISTDLSNLFDDSTGIYANAYGQGRPWERPANVELINPDGTAGFSINAGLRIRGGYSRSPDNPKHGLRLFFRGEYDGPLEYPLFGNEGAQSFQKLDLRADQNYSWSFDGDGRNTAVRDVFSRDTQRDMGNPYTRSRYYHLYIDGQYWGMYQSQERSEAAYGASYFGGSEDDYDVIKVDAGPYKIYASDGNLDAYRELWTAASAGLSSQAAYFKLQGKNPDGSDNPNYKVLLDVDNLIDYMLVIFYGGNLDAPVSWFLGNNAVNNFYALRNRTGRTGFKFFAHDNEHTLLNIDEDRLGPFPAGATFDQFNPQWLHQQLMANSEYLLRFADRVQKFLYNEGALTPGPAIARFTARADQVRPAIAGESARWGDSKREQPFTPNDWQAAIDDVVNNYLPLRTQKVLDQFAAHGLAAALAAPKFLVGGVEKRGGRVVAGGALRFSATAGLVYYTTDGADPRLPGGAIRPGAGVFDPATSPSLMLDNSKTYRVRAKDGATWSPLDEAAFLINDAPSKDNLVLTELHYNPLPPSGSELAVDAQEYEFLELRNIGAREVDLTSLRFTAGITFNFGTGAVPYLAPGAYVIVAKNLNAFRSRYGAGPLVAGTTGTSNLSNGGEAIKLETGSGQVILSFSYDDEGSWPLTPDGGGPSLVPKNPQGNLGDPANWRASLEIGGSPGKAANNAPSLTAPVDLAIDEDTATAALPITVGDDETPVGALVVTATSSDPVLVPAAGLNLSGAGANWSLVVTPAADRNGAATISVSVDDGKGGLTTKTFALTVNPRNDAPRGTADPLRTREDEPLAFTAQDLLTNDLDPDGDAMRVVLERLPQKGALVDRGDGTYSYQPGPDYAGNDSFSYRAADAALASDEIEVSITIDPVNDAPELADPGPQAIVEGGLIQIQLAAGDVDSPQSNLRYALGAGKPDGMTINELTGQISWLAARGPETVVVNVSVRDGGSPEKTHSRDLSIQVANAPPSIDLGQPVAIATKATLNRIGSFADPGLDSWTATIDYGDSGGAKPLVLGSDKTFTLNHAYTKAGNYEITVSIADGAATTVQKLAVKVAEPDKTPPRVARVRTMLSAGRLNSLVVSFNEALDPARAKRVTNFLLTSAGADRRFGTPDDRRVSIKSAELAKSGKDVTLKLSAPLATSLPYRLTVYGASKSRGLTDLAGNLLDGNGDKKPGGNYLKSFGTVAKSRARAAVAFWGNRRRDP